jgi:DNA repair exonuclease SbcCD nuclease subunit
MRNIVFSDPHVDEESIIELEQVFKEIISYKKHADALICVGDYYDKKNPSSVEIDFGTKWVSIFKKEYPEFIMIEGNHPKVSDDISSVKYLKHYGVSVVNDLILDESYYGHFMIKESECGFDESLTYADLEKIHSVKRFILGHQHTFQEFKQMLHPGSCRYVDFGEVKDRHKYIFLVEDGNILPIMLNKVRPMYEVNSIKELEQLPENAQIRIIVNDFEQFKKEINTIEAYKDKFFKFKIKFNFDRAVNTQIINPLQNTNEIILKWLNSINDIDVRTEIATELKEEGIC